MVHVTPNTDRRTPCWAHMEYKEQAAALRSETRCSSDRTVACLTLMIVTPHTRQFDCELLTSLLRTHTAVASSQSLHIQYQLLEGKKVKPGGFLIRLHQFIS